MQIQKKRTASYNENTHSATDDSKSNLITAEELSATLSQFEPLDEDIPTIEALDRCSRLLQGYKGYLKLIGWHDFVENPSFKVKLMRVLWTFALFLFVLIALTTQAMTCFQRDLLKLTNTTNSSFCGKGHHTDRVIHCEANFVSIFVIPAFLQLATYIYGVYLFWGKQEYLENLAEQVYLKSNDHHHLKHLEKHLIKRLILYFCTAILFIIVSLTVRIIHSVVFKMFDDDVAICWKDFNSLITGIEKETLLIITLAGFVILDGVYTSAVTNYAIQSELNISLLHSISMKVKNKGYDDIDAAIRDIDSAYRCVKVLNGKTATLVALVLFNFVSHTIRDIIALGEPSYEHAKEVTVLTLSTMLWAFLGIFPFIQATRVTRACTDLLSVGSVIRIRPLQYKDTPQLDLDSFCIYISSIINMRAEIFGIPVFPWMANTAAISFAFIMLLLCQSGVYQYAEWV